MGVAPAATQDDQAAAASHPEYVQKELELLVIASRVLYLPLFHENETRNDGLAAIAVKMAQLKSSLGYRYHGQSDQRGRKPRPLGRGAPLLAKLTPTFDKCSLNTNFNACMFATAGWFNSGDLLTLIRYVTLREALQDALASPDTDEATRRVLVEVAALVLPLDLIIGLLHAGMYMLSNSLEDVWSIGGAALKDMLRRTDLRPKKTGQKVRKKREFAKLLRGSWVSEALAVFVESEFYTDDLLVAPLEKYDATKAEREAEEEGYARLFVRQFMAFCTNGATNDELFRAWFCTAQTSALMAYFLRCVKLGAMQSGRLIETYWTCIFTAHNNVHYSGAFIDAAYDRYFWSAARNRISEMMWAYPRTNGVVGAFGSSDDT